jgi:hypothetical protein
VREGRGRKQSEVPLFAQNDSYSCLGVCRGKVRRYGRRYVQPGAEDKGAGDILIFREAIGAGRG